MKDKQEELRGKLVIYPPTIKFLHSQDSAVLLGMVSGHNDLICEAATILCTITPNGDMIPCTYFRFPQFVAGNLLEDSFENIWHNSPVFERFRALGELPYECRGCHIANECHGGCRAVSYFQLDDIDAVDPRCWFAVAGERLPSAQGEVS
jgi:radical SAM protein with 4Fe4S-binding SPASM domain